MINVIIAYKKAITNLIHWLIGIVAKWGTAKPNNGVNKMMKRICPMILAVVSLVGSPPTAGQKLTDYDVDLFQLWNDCDPIRLLVELLPEGAKKIGMTRERIQTMAESRLRAARIYSPIGIGYLYVNLNYLDTNAGAYNLIASFKPLVYRDWIGDHIAKKNSASTWDSTYLGVSAGNSVFIMQTISEQIDEFINEYLRVNADSCD